MKIKTVELTGAALDWAVAKCEGRNYAHGECEYSTTSETVWARGGSALFTPSFDWSQGGPIIEREEIQLYTNGSVTKKWEAIQDNADDVIVEYGPTPLIAAMRCYVASKLGDEIEIPEELL